MYDLISYFTIYSQPIGKLKRGRYFAISPVMKLKGTRGQEDYVVR